MITANKDKIKIVLKICVWFSLKGVNVFNKAHNGDTARSLALIHSNMKIVSLIDNHVMPNTCLRSEAGK